MDEKFNLEEIEKYGVMDYYFDLKKFIEIFINNNYPLDSQQMKDILNGVDNSNLYERTFSYNCMINSLKKLIDKKIADNKMFLQKISNGEFMKVETMKEYKQNLLESINFILEELWNKKHKANIEDNVERQSR